MPRPGAQEPVAAAVAATGGSVFSPLAHRLAEHPGPLFPLHVGDTWLAPFEGARVEQLREDAIPGLHRYAPTPGLPPLLDALVERERARTGLAREREELLVTAGATGGLACAVSAVVDPGEEVLVLAPFWPLIRGIVRSHRGVPVEVPFYDRVVSAEEAVAAVEAARSPRTVALYVSTPSNPTGRTIPEAWLEALAAWTRDHDLWLLSDETYDDLVYRGRHVPLAPHAPERTVAVHSFSKTWGLAGNRVGWLAGPPRLVEAAHKAMVHNVYHPPTAGQHAALRVLRDGEAWLERAREAYRAAGEDAARELGLPAPEGSTFLFLDVRDRVGARGVPGLLEDLLEEGVVLAPGASSGRDYEGFLRLCYTSAPPEDVAEAIRRLARVLERAAA
ncbi:MAG: pyridoxal phosphate-dependent aminotransferase [Myxococcota bacterium]|nr:pyridoxal phosphate-dependent aminotransferase [Myxococcota bacterium]